MLKRAWRMVVFAAGMAVLIIGIALLVLPGPAFIVIPVGLAILATEFPWARRWLSRVRSASRKAADQIVRLKSR